MKQIVITPTNSGPISFDFISSLTDTIKKSAAKGVNIHFDPGEKDLSPSLSKTVVANRVLNSELVDGVFFINTSLSWNSEDFFKIILEQDAEDSIISGVYPEAVTHAETYSVALLESFDEFTRLVPVGLVPLGFSYVPKKVLQGLTAFVDKTEHEGEYFYLFFSPRVIEGRYYEDIPAFCNLVTTSGFKIFVDPEVNCSYEGSIQFRSDYKRYLAKVWEQNQVDL